MSASFGTKNMKSIARMLPGSQKIKSVKSTSSTSRKGLATYTDTDTTKGAISGVSGVSLSTVNDIEAQQSIEIDTTGVSDASDAIPIAQFDEGEDVLEVLEQQKKLIMQELPYYGVQKDAHANGGSFASKYVNYELYIMQGLCCIFGGLVLFPNVAVLYILWCTRKPRSSAIITL